MIHYLDPFDRIMRYAVKRYHISATVRFVEPHVVRHSWFREPKGLTEFPED